MTDYETGGYRVSASSEYPNSEYLAWEAFDDDITDNSHAWISGNLLYNQTTGSYNGNVNLGAGVADNGEWIKIEMPHKLVLDYITICGDDNSGVNPKDWKIYGSNDDKNWDVLLSKTNVLVVGRTATSGKEHTVNATKAYKYFALVVTKSGGYNGGNHYIQVSELEFYGHKEGDLTRFPEPTRVLKYPHIAMTGPAQRGYVVSASTEYPDGNYPAWEAFDTNTSVLTRWASENAQNYNGGSYLYSGNKNLGINNGGSGTPNGEWLMIEMPHKLKLQSTKLIANGNSLEVPDKFIIYGSNDLTGAWSVVDNTYETTSAAIPFGEIGKTWTVSTSASPVAYKYFGLVVRNTVASTYLTTVNEWELYGTEEDTGTPAIVGGPFAGKVANFRVYDQYLGDERIQEIYDAQKDEFGHKKSSMTLYKGRVGVGTTEPEGALTVVDERHALAKFPARAVSADDSYVEGDGQIKISAADGTGYQAFDGLTSTSWAATPTRHTRLSEEVDFGAWLKIQTPESVSLKKAEIESNPYWMQVGTTFQGVGVGHQLGDTVACNKDGTRIAIAEPASGGTITAAQDGRVRIYDWNGSGWIQVGQNLTGSQSDYYGAGNMGFSDDGHRFITSSPNDGISGGGSPNAGVVEVYYLSGSTWTILGTPFTSSDGGAQVGKSCAISGDGTTISFVEYQYDDASVGVNAGRTRVFTWNGTTWVQKGSDMIGDVTGDGMGRVMEMTSDGNYIIIGNYSAGSNNGKVWVYAWDGSDWVKRGNTLVGTGADLLGFDVTISDDADTIAIGENHNDDMGTESGAVEIRTWDGSAYVLTQTLYDAEETTGRFGSAVALSGDGTRLVAVTHHSPDGSGSAHGRARVFEYYGGSWQLRQPFTSIGAQGNAGTDGSGSGLGIEDSLAVSRDGSVIVVGLKNDDTSGNANSGQAKVFHMPSNIKSIWGSNDDVNWTKITTGNKTFRGDDRIEFKNLDNPNYYKYHAIVADAFTRLKDIKLFGIRNQGSSTLHDGTLTLTKKVTAPQLESTGIINMKGDYTEIRANSNVVTEFPRSKKFIKYPRVALTSAALNSAYENGYRVTFSHENVAYRAWEAFDANPGDDVGWHSQGPGASAEYNGTGGLYSGTSRLATETELGEWLGLELPEAIKLIDVNMVSQSYSPVTNTIDNFVVYAKKQSGDTWTSLGVFTGVAAAQNSAAGVTVNVDANDYYKFFAIVATKRDSAGANTGVSIRDLAFFGTPEYDPEAHGVDVVVKSVPNVPNTDWLEVYYDGQDYTQMPATVDNKTGVSTYDATPINGVGFDTEYKAFTFDANSSQYLSSSTPVSGNYIHTISMWFKGTNLTSTDGDTLMWVGDNVDNERIEIYIENDLIIYNFRNNDYIADTTFQNNRWYHLTCTYNGTQGSAGREIYVDGQRLSAYHSGNLADLNITNSTLNVGGYSGTSTTYMFSGSIANFRLFNRALTSDEIWQLYAYQKEYFGHGDLGMTLKAGRLGIGTSEPRAALDVRGDARLYGINHCSAYKSDGGYVSKGNSYTWTALAFDTFLTEYGGFGFVNNGIRIPVSGVYHCYTHAVFTKSVTSTFREWRVRVELWVNDTNESNGVDYTNMGKVFENMQLTSGMEGNRGFSQVVLTRTLVLNAGDILYSKVLGHTDSNTEIDERCNNLQVFMIQAI
jgi:hypothetical protein